MMWWCHEKDVVDNYTQLLHYLPMKFDHEVWRHAFLQPICGTLKKMFDLTQTMKDLMLLLIGSRRQKYDDCDRGD